MMGVMFVANHTNSVLIDAYDRHESPLLAVALISMCLGIKIIPRREKNFPANARPEADVMCSN